MVDGVFIFLSSIDSPFFFFFFHLIQLLGIFFLLSYVLRNFFYSISLWLCMQNFTLLLPPSSTPPFCPHIHFYKIKYFICFLHPLFKLHQLPFLFFSLSNATFRRWQQKKMRDDFFSSFTI